jgi:hypothetical protein
MRLVNDIEKALEIANKIWNIESKARNLQNIKLSGDVNKVWRNRICAQISNKFLEHIKCNIPNGMHDIEAQLLAQAAIKSLDQHFSKTQTNIKPIPTIDKKAVQEVVARFTNDLLIYQAQKLTPNLDNCASIAKKTISNRNHSPIRE